MMSNHPAEYLSRKLEQGACRLGQILIAKNLSLSHLDDVGRTDLIRHSDPHDAIAIARYDDDGKYRPLKTAPNLRHGWRLELSDLSQALLALDFLYPAAIGTAAAQEDGKLDPVALRETLERQTGMYAVVKKITDVQAGQVISEICRGNPGCMRRISWDISREQKLSLELAEGNCGPLSETKHAIPLWCAEACNLLVAAGRVVVKKQV